MKPPVEYGVGLLGRFDAGASAADDVDMSSGCAGRMTLPHKEAEQDCPPEKIKADSHPLVVGRFFFRPFYVLKNKAGLPPHCTLIIAIARSRISIANRRLAVLYPTLFARL